MDIGNKIRKYRESSNLSQDELALKVFVSRVTISNWETNKTYPDIKSLALMANIFNVTLDDFVKGDLEEMKNKIDENTLDKFNSLSAIFTVELIVMIISIYPLFAFGKLAGIVIWAVLAVVCLATSLKLEKFKKENDIQTYKEIMAFCEGKSLSHDELQQEFGKRNYQKVIGAVLSGVITFVVFAAMAVLFKWLGF